MLSLNINYDNQTYGLTDMTTNQNISGDVVDLSQDVAMYSHGEIRGFQTFNIEGVFPEKEVSLNNIPNFVMHKPSDYSRYFFDIIGAGGTGGYVVRDLARFLYSLKAKGDTREFVINLYDGDVVEEKNLIRQNFIPKDIGKFKSQVLANRYTAAFGIQINAITEYANESNLYNDNQQNRHPSRDCRVVVGCVDNNKARRAIYQALMGTGSNRHDYWIDSGNERKSGQVICGFKKGLRFYQGAIRTGDLPISNNTNFSTPFVTDIYPEILDESQDDVGDDGTSCAERAVEEEQNIFVNMTAAVHVLNFTRQIIRSESMSIFGLEFNIKGVNNVHYINPEKFISIINN